MDIQLNSTGRLARAVGVASIINMAWGLAHRHYQSVNSKLTYTITVPVSDPIYPKLAAALFELHTKKVSKAIRLISNRDEETLEIYLAEGHKVATVLNGHRASITIERVNEVAAETRHTISVRPNDLLIETYTVEARNAYFEFVKNVSREYWKTKTEPSVMFAGKWGEWYEKKDVPKRELSTIILKDGQRERIIDDLDRFLSSEEKYTRRGLPWHRGYLFYGPPGGGKTSLAMVLATHFGLNIYVMPLSSVNADKELTELVFEIPPKSILLIEDADISSTATERKDANDKRASLSALLNSLDGISTPHGLITILTTNHRDLLDPALLRPGRCDITELIDYLDSQQLYDLFDMYYEQAMPEPITLNKKQKLTPATVLEVFKQYESEPHEAFKALLDL